jgi:Transglutaminase-like superfamily
MKRLRKFLGLSWGDRYLLLSTLVLLLTMRLGLYFLRFRTLLKWVRKVSQTTFQSPVKNQTSPGRIIWSVNAISRYMPGVKCLARALTTHILMSRYGYSPQLQIGVAKAEGGKLEAHAWIEHQGRVAIGHLPDLGRYIPLPSLEGVKL